MRPPVPLLHQISANEPRVGAAEVLPPEEPEESYEITGDPAATQRVDQIDLTDLEDESSIEDQVAEAQVTSAETIDAPTTDPTLQSVVDENIEEITEASVQEISDDLIEEVREVSVQELSDDLVEEVDHASDSQEDAVYEPAEPEPIDAEATTDGLYPLFTQDDETDVNSLAEPKRLDEIRRADAAVQRDAASRRAKAAQRELDESESSLEESEPLLGDVDMPTTVTSNPLSIHKESLPSAMASDSEPPHAPPGSERPQTKPKRGIFGLETATFITPPSDTQLPIDATEHRGDEPEVGEDPTKTHTLPEPSVAEDQRSRRLRQSGFDMDIPTMIAPPRRRAQVSPSQEPLPPRGYPTNADSQRGQPQHQPPKEGVGQPAPHSVAPPWISAKDQLIGWNQDALRAGMPVQPLAPRQPPPQWQQRGRPPIAPTPRLTPPQRPMGGLGLAPDDQMGFIVYRLALPSVESLIGFADNALTSQGVFVRTNQIRPPGTPAVVCVVHPLSGDEFHLPGEVATVPASRPGVAVQFQGITERTASDFHNFIALGIPQDELSMEVRSPYQGFSENELTMVASSEHNTSQNERNLPRENTHEVRLDDLMLITGIGRSEDGKPQRLKTQEINLRELLKGVNLDALDDDE
jgi:hypothetical protein